MIKGMTQEAKELLDAIRSQIELPEKLISLDLHIDKDSPLKVTCTYFPIAKQHPDID